MSKEKNCPLVTGLRPCGCNIPRCPVCRYTEHDAQFEMDHYLCSVSIPDIPEPDPAIAAHAAAEEWFTEATRVGTTPLWRALAPDFFRAIVRNPQGFKALMAEVKAQEDLILYGDPSAHGPVGILSDPAFRGKTGC